MVVRSKYLYKKNWHQPQIVTDLVKKYLKSPSLNICCGISELGDLKADISLDVGAEILVDAFKTPFKYNSFQTVYCDPPWNLPYPPRIKLTKELSTLVKTGGYLIMNCPWVPQMKGMKLTDIHLIYSHYVHQNVALLTILKKVNHILDV